MIKTRIPSKTNLFTFSEVKMETFFSLKIFQDNKNETILFSFLRDLLPFQDNEDHVSLAKSMGIFSGSNNITCCLNWGLLYYNIPLGYIQELTGPYHFTMGNKCPGTASKMLLWLQLLLLWVKNVFLSLTQTSHVSVRYL